MVTRWRKGEKKGIRPRKTAKIFDFPKKYLKKLLLFGKKPHSHRPLSAVCGSFFVSLQRDKKKRPPCVEEALLQRSGEIRQALL
jgi:hypothetical protein